MRRTWALWTLLALGLHALPLLFYRERPPTSLTARSTQAEVEVEIDLEPAQPPRGAPPEAGVGARAAAAEGALASARRVAGVRRATATDLQPLEPSPLREGPTEAEPEPEARAAKAPLSADALGIGPSNPFVGSDLSRVPERKAPRPTAQARLRRSLAEAELKADHARSLGPAGPVLSAVIALTRQSELPANASARFDCVADAQGKLVSVTLLSSTTDPMVWRRIARRVIEALAGKLLRMPSNGHGASFRVWVESRQTLPSGADPGVDITLLGIPLQKGKGERSARIEILNPIPKLEMQRIVTPSGQEIELPTLSVGNILSTNVDPVDIDAPAQRMVHARVETMNVH